MAWELSKFLKSHLKSVPGQREETLGLCSNSFLRRTLKKFERGMFCVKMIC